MTAPRFYLAATAAGLTVAAVVAYTYLSANARAVAVVANAMRPRPVHDYSGAGF